MKMFGGMQAGSLLPGPGQILKVKGAKWAARPPARGRRVGSISHGGLANVYDKENKSFMRGGFF
jgi:hypothetical protein